MDMESDVLDRIVSAVDDRSARGIAAAMSRLVSSGEFPPGMRRGTEVGQRQLADPAIAEWSIAAAVPPALTDYIKNRQDYDYNQHGRADNVHTEFVPHEVIDRFCLLGPPEHHIERLRELPALGVDHFGLYLQHDNKIPTLQGYGDVVIPALSPRAGARA